MDSNSYGKHYGAHPTRHEQLVATAVSNFITSSAVKSKHPFNYPYNIYNNAWEPSVYLANDDDQLRQKLKKWMWWQPEQDSIPAQFLESSSMHGLKYVSQPKRHVLERIFWMGSFLASMIGAVLMILEVWNKYYTNPVIVTFRSSELDLDNIPFPAITICNTNPVKKSTVEGYEKMYKQGRTDTERTYALDALRIINGICLTTESFLQTLNFTSSRGQMIPEAKQNPSLAMERNVTQFLLENSQPCSELLRYCVWGQQQYECEKLFKPIITDYGKCCTFNMLPQELMEPFHSVTENTRQTQYMRRAAWSQKEINEWKKWDYDTTGYILKPELEFPFRQHRAGTADGLSLLIDPDVENNFCPCTDSEGVKVLFHVPLDAPRVADLGSVIGANREAFLEINPDITIADPDIESFNHETRQCYFGLEHKLHFYRPYTRSNCFEECWTNILIESCHCVLYYEPHNSSTNICSTTPGTPDYECVQDNERKYLGKLNRLCKHCKFTCNDLNYNAEITFAKLQDSNILWTLPNGTKHDWMSHRLTVLHIFMGSDSTVPKLRQKLYQAVDLIANTGGLLGLSLGFSVLSLVEIIYFVTIRVCCKQMRKSKQFGQQFNGSTISTAADQGHVKLLDNSSFLHEVNSRNLMTRFGV